MPSENLRAIFQLVKDGHKQEAVAQLFPILKDDPDNADAWWLLANALTNPAEIREALEQVLRLRPFHIQAEEKLAKMTAPPAASRPSSTPPSTQPVVIGPPIPAKAGKQAKPAKEQKVKRRVDQDRLWINLVGMLPFIMGACMLLTVGGTAVREYLTSFSWESTTGQVSRSEVDQEFERKRGRRGCGCWVYYADIEYSYSTVRGTTHIGERIDFEKQVCLVGDLCLGGDSAVRDRLGASEDPDVPAALVNEYYQGRYVTVYYNRGAPQNAVLERTIPKLGTGLALGGLVLGVVVVGFLIHKFRG